MNTNNNQTDSLNVAIDKAIDSGARNVRTSTGIMPLNAWRKLFEEKPRVGWFFRKRYSYSDTRCGEIVLSERDWPYCSVFPTF